MTSAYFEALKKNAQPNDGLRCQKPVWIFLNATLRLGLPADSGGAEERHYDAAKPVNKARRRSHALVRERPIRRPRFRHRPRGVGPH